MTERLRCVVAQIELLPAKQQDAITEAMQRELEEREWDGLVSRPESRRYLDRPVAEAVREDEAGETVGSGERWWGRGRPKRSATG